MCRGLFIELNADIKKPTAIGWFSHESSLIDFVTA